VSRKKNILWAPWRVKYVTESDDMDCIFCEKPQQEKDKENYIIHREKNCYALLNIYPYNNGHTMVAPYMHSGDITEIPEKVFCEMMGLVQRLTGRIRKKMGAHGFNIGINQGRPAGAGFDGHIHVHIVPRWDGDTNFMPVQSGVKVIPESLDSAYKKLSF